MGVWLGGLKARSFRACEIARLKSARDSALPDLARQLRDKVAAGREILTDAGRHGTARPHVGLRDAGAHRG